MSKMKVSVRIPKDLIQRANIAAKVTQKSRGEIVTEALRDHLAELEDEEAFKKDVFDRYLDGQISLGTLNRFLDSGDAESVRISKTLLDQGQEPGDGSKPEE
ncbi:CopG family transcriptional regulator [Halobellus sp. H-GB7]|uniref:CopG family transcriptional regulator n=1 Tax=Halobellus sp. H-GB7 TaxID=3069756 RepID=UPI0027B831E6|nr:CopG family transcriptional regulator [Halobellus sp. H-GB7]MDQ2055659.1 CopG family transcriptional regulator [Halobellus sp. H-GB7]